MSLQGKRIADDGIYLDGKDIERPKEIFIFLGNLIEALNQPTPPRILDVGCGTGLVGERLATLGFSSIDGLDFSPQMLAAAAEKDIYHELLESDLEGTLGIADAIYDAGISCGTFTHGHVGPEALNEIFRVLRSGAVFACTIHTHLWADAGFAQHIAALEAGGIIIVEKLVDKPYFEAAEPDGKFCLMRKL